MSEPETSVGPLVRPGDSPDPPGHAHRGRGPFGNVLLFTGAAICLFVTAEKANVLPFRMPWFWHRNLTLWLAIGIAGLIAGFLMLRPPRGDERDTT